MKKRFNFPNAFFIVSLVFGFASCSYDDDLQPPKTLLSQKPTVANVKNNNISNEDELQKDGTIQLSVTPLSANASVTVYNDNYNSGEMFPTPEANGTYTFPHLALGSYTILIKPYNPLFETMKMDNVEVEANQITNLGEITL